MGGGPNDAETGRGIIRAKSVPPPLIANSPQRIFVRGEYFEWVATRVQPALVGKLHAEDLRFLNDRIDDFS